MTSAEPAAASASDGGAAPAPAPSQIPAAASGGGRWPRSPRLRRAVFAVGLAVAVVVFARATRSEVRYETDPSGAEPIEQRAIDELDRASGGTRCGAWPAALSTTEPPKPRSLHTALWADADAFHVQSAHVYVRAVRFDVAGGTASAGGVAPQASLTVPLDSGGTVDVTISCGASALTVHLVDVAGKDLGGALLDIGDQPGAPAPIELVKNGDPSSRSPGCLQLADAAAAAAQAPPGEARVAAARQLVEVARAQVASVSGSLTEQEQADARAVIGLLEERTSEMDAGRTDVSRAPSGEDAEAIHRMEGTYERLCG